MISTIYILAKNGDVIVEKHMREKFPRSLLHEYWVNSTRGGVALPAATVFNRFAFFSLGFSDIYLLAISPSDTSPIWGIEVLNLILRILRDYLPEVNHRKLLENFSCVYQLMEEIIDYGFPLTTETHELQELVPPPTLENRVRAALDASLKTKDKPAGSPNAGGMIGISSTDAASATVPWRDIGVSHSNNQMLFDIVELMDVTMDTEGNISRSCLRGVIECKCQMSGMPDVSLVLSNTEQIDDIAFHRCVRVKRYEADRSISFVPPEGFFTLAEFRTKPLLKMNPPFYISPQVSFHKEGGRISVMVGLKQGGMGLTAEEKNIQRLSINIPLPVMASSVNVSNCTGGEAKFDATKKQLVWKIGALEGATLSLAAEVHFAKALDHDPGPYGEYVSVDFSIPNHSQCGVRVGAVNIYNENYKVFKGAKNVVRAGKFFIRAQ
jgi:AP-3 complex subunit mu